MSRGKKRNVSGSRNGNRNGAPKRYKSTDNRRADREETRDANYSGSARNDVSWYNRNPNLLLAAGSFPYPYRPGMALTLGEFTLDGSVQRKKYTLPGAMVLDWMPNLGISNLATDPASILGKEMYARVRQVYSGSLDADAPDFVMYVMAIDSITAYIAWLKRVYRCINAWSPENYFMPDGLLVGMGFSYPEIANLRTDKTNLWQCINDLILQSHKFTVPSSLDVLNRHYWMNDNVYTDAQSLNSQFYMFNMKALFKYGEVAMPNGDPAAGLVMTALPTQVVRSTPLKVADLYQFGVDLINALVAWDDAYTINGYLRRAFEGDAQFVVGEISSTEILTPVYEPEVLMQIENSRAAPALSGVTNFSSFNVSQDVATNAVISNPSYEVATGDPLGLTDLGGWDLAPILSVRSDSPTVADSVVASRLQSSVVGTIKGSVMSFTIDAGSEIPIGWKVSTLTNGLVTFNDYVQTPVIKIELSDTANLRSQLAALVDAYAVEAFDWHPFSYLLYILYDNGKWKTYSTRLCGDLHNATTITRENLANLHKICLYSEFNSFGLI